MMQHSFLKGEVVALKKLKMEKEKEGFPITSLREINMLLKAIHPNVVFVRVSALCVISGEDFLKNNLGFSISGVGCR